MHCYYVYFCTSKIRLKLNIPSNLEEEKHFSESDNLVEG